MPNKPNTPTLKTVLAPKTTTAVKRLKPMVTPAPIATQTTNTLSDVDKKFAKRVTAALPVYEGYRKKVYTDVGSDGSKVKAIGYGTRLNLPIYDDIFTDNKLDKTKLDTWVITPQIAEKLTNRYVSRIVIPGLRGVFPNFDTFPNSTKLALADMVYNLGVPKFKNFEKLISYGKSYDPKKSPQALLGMYREIEDSEYARNKTSKKRAKHNKLRVLNDYKDTEHYKNYLERQKQGTPKTPIQQQRRQTKLTQTGYMQPSPQLDNMYKIAFRWLDTIDLIHKYKLFEPKR